MSTASWGRTERYKFNSVGSLVNWSREALPALYVITYKQKPDVKPNSHTVLYFGECEDLSKEDGTLTNVLRNWAEDGGKADELYVFVRPMPGSSQFDRAKIQRALVGEYYPRANMYCM
jgi:hypothetical protein